MAGTRSLGQLTLDLIMKLGGFTAGMDQAARISEKRMREIRKNAEVVGRGIGLALSAGATAAAYAIKKSIDAADELSKAAQKIGIPTEVLSQLKYAGELADVSLEQIQGGLSKLIKFQAGAAQGSKENIKVFEAFGIAIKDNEGHLRDTQSVLRDFADVFKALPDGPEKTALALRVFGKAGAELIPLLNEGSDGLRKMADEAEKLGVVIDTETGKRAEEFNDNLTRLETAVGGLANAVAADLLPDLVDLTNAFVNNATEGNHLKDTAHDIGDGIRFIGSAAVFAVDSVKALTSTSIGLYNVLEGLSTLNPGYALTKFFGTEGNNFHQAGIAFDQASDFGQHPESKQVAPEHRHAGSSARGGQGKLDAEATRRYLAASKSLYEADIKETKAKKGKSDADKAAEEAARRHAEAMDDLADSIKKTQEAAKDFTTQLEDLRAAGDPLAEAKLDYERQGAALKKLAEDGEVGAVKQAEAEKLLAEAYAKTTAEIKERLDTGGAQLKQMQQELDLLNLQTEAERVRAQFMIDNPTASTSQADAAVRISAQIDETRKQIDQMDELRDASTDAFMSIADGSESAIDALKDFGNAFAAMLQRMAAEWATSALFGQQGTTGGGLFGNLLAGLFGGGSNSGASLSQAVDWSAWDGFAEGTDYAPGGMAWVGEKGKELVNLPRGAQVIPHRESMALAGGSIDQTNNFYLSAPTDPRTQQQIASISGYQVQRAARRNGAL